MEAGMHGRMRLVESRKGKPDRYRFILPPLLKNMAVPIENSVAVNVPIEACTVGLFQTPPGVGLQKPPVDSAVGIR